MATTQEKERPRNDWKFIKALKLSDIRPDKPMKVLKYKGRPLKLSIVHETRYQTGRKEVKRIIIPVAQCNAEITFQKYAREGKEPLWI